MRSPIGAHGVIPPRPNLNVTEGSVWGDGYPYGPLGGLVPLRPSDRPWEGVDMGPIPGRATPDQPHMRRGGKGHVSSNA